MSEINKKAKPEFGIQERTFKFAIECIRLVSTLPRNTAGFELGKQLIRAGTSIGANVEEAQGSHTRKEFINCMNIAKKESRETNYWLRVLKSSELMDGAKLESLLRESEVMQRILTSIVKSSQTHPECRNSVRKTSGSRSDTYESSFIRDNP